MGHITARYCVEVDDGVDSLLGAEVNDSVKVLEAFLLENPRIHVICSFASAQVHHPNYHGRDAFTFKVAIINRQPDAIESQRLVKLGIVFSKEVLKKLFEEEAGLLFTNGFGESFSNLIFSARKTGDEIFHCIVIVTSDYHGEDWE